MFPSENNSLLRPRWFFVTTGLLITFIFLSFFVQLTGAGDENSPPLIHVSMEKYSYTIGDNIFFDATGTFDPDTGDSSDLIYEWDFGDGTLEASSKSKSSIYHKYMKPNKYEVVLSVSDGESEGSYSFHINISDVFPNVEIISPTNGAILDIDVPVVFEAAPHFIGDRLVLYEWDFNNDGITDHFTPEKRLELTFDEPALNRIVTLKLTDINGMLGDGNDSVKIHIVKEERAIVFLTPGNEQNFDPRDRINFSATFHGLTGEQLFYEWDFNGDGVVDDVTENNFTWYSFGECHSGKTFIASVSIGNSSGTFFTSGQLKISINEYVAFGETLSPTQVIAGLTIFGFIIIVGFFGTWILKKFSIPEVLSLVTLGVLLVPIGNLMDPEPLFRISTIFGSVALMIILFDGGLALNLQKVRMETSRALLLALTGFVLTIFAIGFFSAYVMFDGKLAVGILFGAVIGGTSGSIVLPLISKLNASENTRALVSIESSLTDVFCIVLAIAIANYISPINGLFEASSGFKLAFSSFIGAFAIGIVSGLLLGLIWITMLKAFQHFQYSFMLTIAVAFLLFAFNEFAGGSGPVSVLIFGLILANGKEIGGMLRLKNVSEVSQSMKDFHSQLSFIIRTFFFVFLGVIVSKSLFSIGGIRVWGYGLILIGLIAVVRWVAVKLVIRKGEAKKDSYLLSMLLPRGLAAAVLAMIPVTHHFLDNGILNARQIVLFFDSTFVVIIFSVVFTTIGVPLAQRQMKRNNCIPSARVNDEHESANSRDILKKQVTSVHKKLRTKKDMDADVIDGIDNVPSTQ